MPDNETFGARLERLMKERKITREELGKIVDRNTNTIGHYINGTTEPKFQQVKVLASFFGVSIGYLIGGEERSKSDVKVIGFDDPRKFELPLVSIKARAGFAQSTDGIQISAIQESAEVSQKDIEEYPKAIVIEVEGDSMEPRLKSGDRVLINQIPKENWHNQYNAVYVVEYDQTITIKRIKNNDLINGKLTLHPDNTEEAGPVTIFMEEIRSIWKVIKIVDTKKI